MRVFTLLFTVLAINGCAGAALAAGKIRLAQSSTLTNCMMTCNTQGANCQSACLLPGTPPAASATTTSNATANATCLLNCTTAQLACHTTCAQRSPSR